MNFHNLHLPDRGLISLLSQDSDNFIFIKNERSIYQYGNQKFLELYGLNKFKDLYQQTDYTLCRDKKKILAYREADGQVLETEKILLLNDEVLPQKNELLTKHMVGTLYPLYSAGSKPVGVVGIVKPYCKPFKLTLETAVCLTSEEINKNVTRRSYKVQAFNQTLNLARREVHCMIELIQGKHAGEIAESLQLKQATIEFYIENLKNKLGATSKSSLLMTIFNQKIIQQIIL